MMNQQKANDISHFAVPSQTLQFRGLWWFMDVHWFIGGWGAVLCPGLFLQTYNPC